MGVTGIGIGDGQGADGGPGSGSWGDESGAEHEVFWRLRRGRGQFSQDITTESGVGTIDDSR